MTMRLALQAVVIGLILKLTIPEFVEIQRLQGRELRKRLDLPRSCDPEVAAMRTSPRGRVTVLVMCGDREDADADARTFVEQDHDRHGRQIKGMVSSSRLLSHATYSTLVATDDQ
jgi:hypothetical protein